MLKSLFSGVFAFVCKHINEISNERLNINRYNRFNYSGPNIYTSEKNTINAFTECAKAL